MLEDDRVSFGSWLLYFLLTSIPGIQFAVMVISAVVYHEKKPTLSNYAVASIIWTVISGFLLAMLVAVLLILGGAIASAGGL